MQELSKKEMISLILYTSVFSGIFGFIYETFFYKIDLGYFIKRGSSYGPWIPIYAIGGLCIILIAYRYRKKPILVFLLSMIISGILEYTTGYMLWHYHHIRLWDYNTEIWNFGNINGYICLRSVLFFGLSSLFLVYVMVPFFKKYFVKKRFSLLISIILCSLFTVDLLVYQIIN